MAGRADSRPVIVGPIAVFGMMIASGCLTRGVTYECSEDQQCTLGPGAGRCEPSGFCSYVDDECESDRRYGPFAGDEADRCVPLLLATGSGTATTAGTAGTEGTEGTEGSSTDWLLVIDERTDQTVLERIDLTTGIGRTLCSLPGASDYSSLAFARDGTLYAHNTTMMQLETLDPCSCELTTVGATGIDLLQLTVDAGDGLVGIDPGAETWVSIDRATAEVSPIGPLGLDFEFGGVTWSDEHGAAFAIEALSDRLDRIDPVTGIASTVTTLGLDFQTVGLDVGPSGGLLACGSTSVLYRIDPVTGEIQPSVTLGLQSSCDNLAVPWAPIACVNGS